MDRRLHLKFLGASTLLLASNSRIRAQNLPGYPSGNASEATADLGTWRSPADCYFAYPHQNGFIPGTQDLILGRRSTDGRNTEFVSWNFRTGATQLQYVVDAGTMYCDVSLSFPELFLIKGRRVVEAVQLNGSKTARPVFKFEPRDGYVPSGSLSVRPDGKAVLIADQYIPARKGPAQSVELSEIEINSGSKRLLCIEPFNADHQQYCPGFPNWIGFAHEGNACTTPDRVWGIDVAHSSEPKVVWGGQEHGVQLCIGHERWAFDRPGVYVVAYPESPGTEKGLYFVDANNRFALLVSASNYDWHCNVSRDGKWAVVDTKPPRDKPREEDGRIISDIVLVEIPTGRRKWLARSHAADHPWHPHPHFSPNGKYVIYNDYQAGGAGSSSFTIVKQLF